MKPRGFIAFLGSAALFWLIAAHAQSPTVGFLRSASPESSMHLVAAFRQGLKESGYIEGQNVTIEFRWANGKNELLPSLIADLARRQVAVIVANNVAAEAAKAANTPVPIVFVMGSDPVDAGLVASLNRPGGNITGVSFLSGELDTKRVELLHELLPTAVNIGYLVNPSGSSEEYVKSVQNAARAIGKQIQVVSASNDREIDTAFAAFAQQQAGALVVGADVLFNSHRDQIVALATRYGIPAVYEWREFVQAGGLMSYGPSQTDAYRQAGIYAARILKGAKPADLPVMQPTKFELVVNLKAAKALGIAVPTSILLRADEVIE